MKSIKREKTKKKRLRKFPVSGRSVFALARLIYERAMIDTGRLKKRR